MSPRPDGRSSPQRPNRRRPEPAQDDRDRLDSALAEAWSLLGRLARLMPEPSGTGPATGTIGRHAPESSEPWQAEAAHAYWAIHFGLRKLRDEMRTAAGLTADPLSGSGTHTGKAISDVSALGSIVPADLLADARFRVESWVTAGRRIRDIDEVETWTPVPRVPGAEPPMCPYCCTLSLRMSRTRQEVRCFNPECRDLDGNPVRARMEPGVLSDTGQLVFGDDTVVAYREEQRPETGDPHGRAAPDIEPGAP